MRTPSLVNKIALDDPLALLPLSQLGYPPRALIAVETATKTIGVSLTKGRGDSDVK